MGGQAPVRACFAGQAVGFVGIFLGKGFGAGKEGLICLAALKPEVVRFLGPLAAVFQIFGDPLAAKPRFLGYSRIQYQRRNRLVH